MDLVTLAAAKKIAKGGVLVVADTNGTLDKTWTEIHNALLSNGAVINRNDDSIMTVTSAYIGKGEYFIDAGGQNMRATYSADSASGYPALPEDDSTPVQ